MTRICWSSVAFWPTSVEKQMTTAAAITPVVAASTPNTRGCATIDRYVSPGEKITPTIRATNPLGAAGPIPEDGGWVSGTGSLVEGRIEIYTVAARPMFPNTPFY